MRRSPTLQISWPAATSTLTHSPSVPSFLTTAVYLSAIWRSFSVSKKPLRTSGYANSTTQQTSRTDRRSLDDLQETRLSSLRPVGEFFDVNRVSRPADFNTAVTRVTYNTRHFSGKHQTTAPNSHILCYEVNVVFILLRPRKLSHCNGRPCNLRTCHQPDAPYCHRFPVWWIYRNQQVGCVCLSARTSPTVRTDHVINCSPGTLTSWRSNCDVSKNYSGLPSVYLSFLQAKAPLYWSFCYWVIFCLHRCEGSSNFLLLCCSIPLLWFAAPFATIFWIIGASAVLILGHAAMTEPGVESEYTQVAETV